MLRGALRVSCLAAVTAGLVVSCDGPGSGDGETHWLACATDLDCPTGRRCSDGLCVEEWDADSGGVGGDSGISDGDAMSSTGGGGTGGASMEASVDAGRDARSTDGARDTGVADAPDATTGVSPDGATESGSSDATVDGMECTPGASRCTGGTVSSGVVTCDAWGRWNDPWPCAAGICINGSCAGKTTTGTSCASGGDGLDNCGTLSESCCTSLAVPGGTFYRTYDVALADGGVSRAADGGPTDLADPATVSGFRFDKYLVTVGRFRQFVAAWNNGTGWTPPAGSGKHTHVNGGQGLRAYISAPIPVAFETGWQTADDANLAPTTANLTCGGANTTWTDTPGSHETLPITCMNWYEAYAFCAWDGGFLPTDAEGEYAAAGGDEQRFYPWGVAPPGTANQYAIYGCNYPNGTGTCGGISSLAPVGSAPLGAGRWGQLDLAGEVFEWEQDYGMVLTGWDCVDCAVLEGFFSGRVLRGGNWVSSMYMRPPTRYGAASVYRGPGGGFRCARTP